MSSPKTSIIWFRRDLRINDHPALLAAIESSDQVIPLFILDKQQIKGLPKNIIGLSRTDNKKELVELYNAADVFLNLSEEETFGLTTVEAMACGTPVIVYNKTASPELVQPETGMVIEKGDIDALYSAIESIKQKGKKAYSLACRNHIEDNFNVNDRFEEYFNLYNQMMCK